MSRIRFVSNEHLVATQQWNIPATSSRGSGFGSLLDELPVISAKSVRTSDRTRRKRGVGFDPSVTLYHKNSCSAAVGLRVRTTET